MRRILLVLPLLALAGCDDGSAGRQKLAQCMLSPSAKSSSGDWNDVYLATCMQDKGFVVDGSRTSMGAKCEALDYPAIEASCYRPDNALAKWLSENGQKSN